MDTRPAAAEKPAVAGDVRKTARKRSQRLKAEGSAASQASSSSAGSSLASSRVSTPSLAANALASGSSAALSASVSSTSTTSDIIRVKYQYSRDELLKFRCSPLAKCRPEALSGDHEVGDGVWDPEHWFGSFTTNAADLANNSAPPPREKRKTVDTEHDTTIRKRPAGNGTKPAAVSDDNTGDDIILVPQRSSFLTGCQVKRTTTDSKRDSRDRKEGPRIGSGRIQISERLVDQRNDDRNRYSRDEQQPVFERTENSRRRFDRDPDDGGRTRFSRDLDEGLTGRYDRDEDFRGGRFERDDRTSKGRFDREKEDKGYDIRRKDIGSKMKHDFTDRRDVGDRRTNRPGMFSSSRNDQYSSGYNQRHNAEPEWYTEGPVSQSDTIELHGFEGSRNTKSESDNGTTKKDNGSSKFRTKRESEKISAAAQESDEAKNKTDHRVHFEDKSDLSKHSTDEAAASNQLHNGDCSQQPEQETRSQQAQTESSAANNQNIGIFNELTGSSSRGSEFDFNEFFRIDSSALGLGLEGPSPADSGPGSRFQQFFGLNPSAAGNGTEPYQLAHQDSAADVLFGLPVGSSSQSNAVDARSLLDMLRQSDHQAPSLPSIYLDSRLNHHNPAQAQPQPQTQVDMVANVKALISSMQPNSNQPVLPPGGKILHAEDLEASLLSPNKQPGPGSSSTPTTSVNVVQNIVTAVSCHEGTVESSQSSRKPTRPGPVPGPVHGNVAAGPVPSLPAGARVTTLEELEAGLRGVELSSQSVSNIGASVNDQGHSDETSDGDLSAFNKLLGLVNKASVSTSSSSDTTMRSNGLNAQHQHLLTSMAQQSAAVQMPAAEAHSHQPASSAAVDKSNNLFAVPGNVQIPAHQLQQQAVALRMQQLQQQQQKLYQQQQQQQQQLLYQQHQASVTDQQLLNYIKQNAPPFTGASTNLMHGPISPVAAQRQMHANYSPRAPSPVMFGNQPPVNITAPLPIHSRQRSPFGHLQANDTVALMQSVIQRQLNEQKSHQQQQLAQHYDRSSMPNSNSLNENYSVSKPAVPAAFTPTSVIRKMASMKADEKLAREDAPSIAIPAAAGGNPGISGSTANINSLGDSCPVSPNSRQNPPFEQNRNARRLVGQGLMPSGYQSNDILSTGTLPMFTQGPPMPVGRPIVKGQMPLMPAPTGNTALPADQLRHMNHLMAQLSQRPPGMNQSQLPDGVLGSAPFISPFVGPAVNTQQPTANNALLLQHIQRAMQQQQQQQQQQQPQAYGHQPLQTRAMKQTGVGASTPAQRPLLINSAPAADSADRRTDAIARWFGSEVYDHRLPIMPGQKAMTVDEIECAPPPTN